jgi:hypothetical protein
MTGGCWVAHPARNIAATISDRNVIRLSLAALTPPARWRYTPRMKLRDIIEWSVRWSTPSGTMEEDAPVADGVLVDLSLWGTSIIGLAVQRPDGKYFGSITALEPVYDHVLESLKRNHGRKLREVMDADIDISDVIQ